MDIGGTEKQIYSLIKHIHHHDFHCHVFAFESKGPLLHLLKDIGVPVYSGGLKRGDITTKPWKLVFSMFQLMLWTKKLQPVIIHAFLPLITFLGALSGRAFGVPLVIISRRALSTHQDRYSILKPLDRMANCLCHRITVNSKAVWKDMVKRDRIDPSKLFLIYNGVETTLFESAALDREGIRKRLGIKKHEKIVILLANLIPYKGHSDFFKAAQKVVNRFPETRFLIAGEDRGIQKLLEQEIQNLGISEYVKFLGRRNDVPKLLAASDISVLPSHEEGFSNVVLESMAAALPVVATHVGGNPEAIDDGETGWLVPPHNSNALAGRIIDLLEDLNKARLWGKRGKQKVSEHFSIEKMVKNHLILYQSLLS